MGVKKRLEGWQEKMACNCEHRRWGILTLALLFMVAGALTEESLSDHDDTTFAQNINKSGDPAKTGIPQQSVLPLKGLRVYILVGLVHVPSHLRATNLH